MFLVHFFLDLLVVLLLFFLVYLIWLTVHLFFCRLQSRQASLVHKPRISQAILRTLLFFWFSLCGSGLALGYLILKGFAMMNMGMSAVSIPVPSQFQKNVEHWGLALIFMPVFLGIIASFAARSKKSMIFWRWMAYVLFLFVAGLLLLAVFDNDKVSLGEVGKGLVVSALVAICFTPIHLGWLGLAGFFSKTSPPPAIEHSKS